MNRVVRLNRLLDEVDVFERPLDARKIEIGNVTDDLVHVKPGSLFCCAGDSVEQSADLATKAIDRGAVAILVEREFASSVPQVRVSSVREALGPVSAAFWDHPARHLRMAGVTGTYGKTITAHLLAAIFRANRWKTAAIGTLTGVYTTPPASELQELLAGLQQEKHNAVVMEVSARGIEQGHLDSIRFQVVVFTNLIEDYDDDFKTMSRRLESKSMLFDPGRADKAVVNVDDPWGARLIERLALQAIPYSLQDAKDLVIGPYGSEFVWEGVPVRLALIGEINVYNALAAATAAKAMGIWPATIAKTLSGLSAPSGRVERVDLGQPFVVLVDYAHTPASLAKLLEVARNTAVVLDGRVIVTFGCAGACGCATASGCACFGGRACTDECAPQKRAQMGAIAQRLADVVLVTSDNPRIEDPRAIVDQVLAGMQDPHGAQVDLDRGLAIRLAINQARPGDVVVIAGKGHETAQEISGTKISFDDRLVARHALEGLGYQPSLAEHDAIEIARRANEPAAS